MAALSLQESTVQRDFTWLLRVMSEIAPSEGGGLAGTLSYDGIWTPDPRSLQGKLGILVPETVILEKGKPKRCGRNLKQAAQCWNVEFIVARYIQY